MTALESSKREPGVITYQDIGPEDHGILTCSVQIAFTGSVQAFGNLALDSAQLDSFVSCLCAAFGVQHPSELVGKKCFTLRCWGDLGDTIEGLESVDTGRIFTITGWCKRCDIKRGSPLEMRRQSIVREIAHLERRLAEERGRLALVREGYTSWEGHYQAE